MSIDALLVNDRRHAVVVVTGHVEDGCGALLRSKLRICARLHTVVDLRQVDGVSTEVAKALLWALGCALDHGRTVRLVVRDERQRRLLAGLSLNAMMPVHSTIAEATQAIDAVVAQAAQAPAR